MSKTANRAVAAILNEYERSITDLIGVLKNISANHLIKIRDTNTDDTDCVSIQSILAHICKSSYGYLNLILVNQNKSKCIVPSNFTFINVDVYIKELRKVVEMNKKHLGNLPDTVLESTKKEDTINTSWGQLYTIEQLLEHAIVHVLRHRFQIENFLKQ